MFYTPKAWKTKCLYIEELVRESRRSRSGATTRRKRICGAAEVERKEVASTEEPR